MGFHGLLFGFHIRKHHKHDLLGLGPHELFPLGELRLPFEMDLQQFQSATGVCLKLFPAYEYLKTNFYITLNLFHLMTTFVREPIEFSLPAMSAHNFSHLLLLPPNSNLFETISGKLES